MMRISLLAIAITTTLAACGDDQTSTPPDGSPPSRRITGAAAIVATDQQGHATRFAIDLHDDLITAQFPTGDGWDVREGVASSDGSFAIDDAPTGDYWLEVEDVLTGQRQLLWTDATTLAFEEGVNGRGDAAVAGPSTTLSFDLDGLDQAQDGDGLQLASGNLGLSANLIGALVTGDTTVQTTRAWAGNPLISAAAHDDLTIAQTRDAVDAATGIESTSIVKAATFDAIEQADRHDTSITGSFVTPPALAFDLRWSRSAFAAAAADIHPSRVGPADVGNVALQAMPGGTANGTSPLAPLVLTINTPLTGTDDLDLPFAIHNPYPASWLFGTYAIGFPIAVPAPGDPAQEADFDALMEVITDQLPDADHPIVPLVTPPRHPTIAGMDLFADHDGVGSFPTIAWSAPAQGTPTAYIVRVLHWSIDPTGTSPVVVATLIVPGDVTSVRMPDRVLAPGEHYFLDLAAISQRGQDVRVHSLYTLGVPYGFAEAFTNTFSP